MTFLYVRSSDGNNADDGLSWTNAKATIAGAAAIDVAGDTIFVSQAHSESGTSFAPTWEGSASSPTQILAVNDSATPPTVSVTGVSITTTTGTILLSSVTPTGGSVYWKGFDFFAGSGQSSTVNIQCGTGSIRVQAEDCDLTLLSTGSSSAITNSSGNAFSRLINCGFSFSSTAHRINFIGAMEIYGGGLLVGTTQPTSLFTHSGNGFLFVSGFDLTEGSSSMDLIAASNASTFHAIFRNCKLPAGWNGNLFGGTSNAESWAEMHSCDDGDIVYKYRRQTAYGTIDHDTTNVRNGGANVGSQAFSWRMVSTSACAATVSALVTGEFQKRNTVTGVAQTATVEILHDSVTALKDTEIWLEMEYMGDSGFTLTTFTTDRSDVVGSGSNQTSSVEVWDATGFTNPNKQKLQIPFTAEESGFITCRVWLAKASKTVFVDPKVVLTV